jgi:hypothetical protein
MALSLAVGVAALAALAECLRHRQGYAITLVEAACLAAADARNVLLRPQ